MDALAASDRRQWSAPAGRRRRAAGCTAQTAIALL